MQIKKDSFVTKHLKIPSFNIKISSKKFSTKKILEYFHKKNKFLLTIKSKYKINYISKNSPLKFVSTSILYFVKRKDLKNKRAYDYKCRLAKRKDLKDIKYICLNGDTSSHYYKDKRLNNKFRRNLRYYWVSNFFKNKRGDYLAVYEESRKVVGFLLLLKKKKKIVIDLIAIDNKFQNRGIASKLISFATDIIFKKNFSEIFAGTQNDNINAKKFYKKLGFKLIKKENVYHYLKLK